MVLRGIVNVRGELLLCVSLGYLFKLKKSEKEYIQDKPIHQRYIVVVANDEFYTFPASEVRDTIRFDVDTLQKPPSTIAGSAGSYVKGIIHHDGIDIGFIDSELLFNALHRSTG